MKKIFIICFLSLILFGCSNAEYNLTINDDSFYEDINVYFDNDSSYSFIDYDFYPLHSNVDNIYEKKIENFNGMTKLNLKYKYSVEEFGNSNTLNQCFDYKDLDFNDDFYYINIGNFNGCITNPDFVINIKTNNKVLFNNANSVKNNVYSWYINSDNVNDFSLEIKVSKGIYKLETKYVILIFSFILFLLLILSYIFFKKKKSSDNI